MHKRKTSITIASKKKVIALNYLLLISLTELRTLPSFVTSIMREPRAGLPCSKENDARTALENLE